MGGIGGRRRGAAISASAKTLWSACKQIHFTDNESSAIPLGTVAVERQVIKYTGDRHVISPVTSLGIALTETGHPRSNHPNHRGGLLE